MSSAPIEAVLQAGDTETLYRRAGDGPPVLLICCGVLADPVGGALFERLATRFRVVAATIPSCAAGADLLTTWLCEVVEGLGLVRPHVVIDEALAGELLDGAFGGTDSFATVVAAVAAEPDEVAAARHEALRARGVAVVPVDPAGPAATAAAMTPHLGA